MGFTANEIRSALGELDVARNLRAGQLQFPVRSDIYKFREAQLRAELNRLVR
jgi:hypothetical protein